MGFDLGTMIADLEEILALEQKPKNKEKLLAERLAWWKQYAKECGKLAA